CDGWRYAPLLQFLSQPRLTFLSFSGLFFSLSSGGDHRDLLSFPTRRSSDLCRTATWWTSCCVETPARHPGAAWPPAAGCGSNGRSEEHTSELQSRENLVCRLLLEKKKQTDERRDPRRRRRRHRDGRRRLLPR